MPPPEIHRQNGITYAPFSDLRITSTMTLLLRFSKIPDEYLAGSLADSPLPVVLDLALPPTADRSLSDIWSSLGGELKPSLDLAVVAPFDPQRSYETGPPVIEEPVLGVVPVEGEPPRASRRALADGAEEIVAGDTHPGRTLRITRHDAAKRPTRPGPGTEPS